MISSILYVAVGVCVYYNATVAIDVHNGFKRSRNKRFKIAKRVLLSTVGIGSIIQHMVSYVSDTSGALFIVSMLLVVFVTIVNHSRYERGRVRQESDPH